MGSQFDVTAVILAGGMGRRMRSTDKGLMPFNGISIIDRIISQLKPQCKNIMINANRHSWKYKQFSFPIFPDEITNYQKGPLAGMHAALAKIHTPWMITLPCDGPFLSNEYVTRMKQAINNDKLIAVAYVSDRIQPVYSLIHRTMRKDLGQFLKTGERKIDRWYSQHDFAKVDLSDIRETFTNINTQEELKRLEQQYSKHSY